MDFQKKYNNKEILVIGGGTSTLDVKWEGVINPDTYIWTCNDFYRNERVRSQNIDLYQLGYQTDLTNIILKDKLRTNKPFAYFEPEHYRGKQNSQEFKKFVEDIGYGVYNMDIDYSNLFETKSRYTLDGYKYSYRPAQKSGAILRLIILALSTRARKVYFVGFDGFNKDFSNKHAFTGHVGLKDSDQRRDWDKTPMSYVGVFEDAYRLLASREDNKRLQNLGEGFDYNLGTRLSKEYFKLTDETYEAIR
jgi:hypothetical protein